jgi:hypothetical protein
MGFLLLLRQRRPAKSCSTAVVIIYPWRRDIRIRLEIVQCVAARQAIVDYRLSSTVCVLQNRSRPSLLYVDSTDAMVSACCPPCRAQQVQGVYSAVVVKKNHIFWFNIYLLPLWLSKYNYN